MRQVHGEVNTVIEIIDRGIVRPKLGRLVLGKRGVCPSRVLGRWDQFHRHTASSCTVETSQSLMQDSGNEEQASSWKVSRTGGALLLSGKSHAF